MKLDSFYNLAIYLLRHVRRVVRDVGALRLEGSIWFLVTRIGASGYTVRACEQPDSERVTVHACLNNTNISCIQSLHFIQNCVRVLFTSPKQAKFKNHGNDAHGVFVNINITYIWFFKRRGLFCGLMVNLSVSVTNWLNDGFGPSKKGCF